MVSADGWQHRYEKQFVSRDPHCQEQERASAFHPYVI